MIINVADRLNTTKEYYFSVKLREIAEMNARGENVINLGVGSPDHVPNQRVVDQLHNEIDCSQAHGYQSYKGLPELRRGFSDFYMQQYGVVLDPETEMLPLMGSKEGIMHISMAFVNAGDIVLVPNPGYPTYESVSKLVGAEVLHYDLDENNGWMPDLERFDAAILDKVKLLWINYPNMPTGVFPDVERLKKVLTLAKKHNILTVNDNPYSKILYPKSFSIFQLKEFRNNCLELNSTSKSFNMAGWRVGLLSGEKEYISAVLKVKSNMDSGMFKPLQRAAVEALSLDNSWYDRMNSIYENRRAIAESIFDTLDCQYSKSAGGLFVWAKVGKDGYDGKMLSEKVLNEAKVFIAPGFIFGSKGRQYVRMALCTKTAIMQDALARIKKIQW